MTQPAIYPVEGPRGPFHRLGTFDTHYTADRSNMQVVGVVNLTLKSG